MNSRITSSSIALVLLLFIGVIIAFSSAVNAEVQTFACADYNNTINVKNLDQKDGIQITGTGSGNCTVFILDSHLGFIKFPEPIVGSMSEIFIQNNTFYDIGNQNAQTLPGSIESRAAVYFADSLSDIARVFIVDNRWKTTGTYCNCFAGVGYSLSFFIFQNGVDTRTQQGLHINNNSWDATMTALPNGGPAPTGDQPLLRFSFVFASFASGVTQTGQPLNFALNTFAVKTSVNQTFTVLFISNSYGFNDSPLYLINNKIDWLLVDAREITQAQIVSINGNCQTSGSPLLNLRSNQIKFHSALAKMPETNTVFFSLASFGGTLTFTPSASSVSTAPYNWIQLSSFNEILIETHCQTSLVNLILFQAQVQLVALNITDTVLESALISNGRTVFSWVSLQTSVSSAQDPNFGNSLGSIDISRNFWKHEVNAPNADGANGYFVFFQPNQADTININYLGLTQNNVTTETNTSLVAGTSQMLLFYAQQPYNAQGEPVDGNPVSVGTMEVTGNLVTAFMTGIIAEFALIANSNTLYSTKSIIVQLNFVTLSAPHAALAATTVADTNTLVFKGSVDILLNFVTVYRYECFAGLGIPCDELTAVGRPLAVSLLSLAGQQYQFNKAVAINGNEIRVASSNVLIAKAKDYDFQGIQILRNNGAQLTIDKKMQLDANTIYANIATPKFNASSVPAAETLNRLPIMIMQSTSYAHGNVELFSLTATSLVLSNNNIIAECAPCVVASFGLNITDTQSASASLKIDDFSITTNNITIAPPSNLDGTLFPDPDFNAYFMVASQLMLCVPAPHANPFTCHNPLEVDGANFGNPSINIKNDITSIKFPASWNIGPAYTPGSAKFPDGFQDTAFQLALNFLPNNSFPQSFSNPPSMLLQNNEFNWGGVQRDSTSWMNFLASTYIASVFSMGAAALDPDSQMILDLGVMSIKYCDQGTLLGGPIKILLEFVGVTATDSCPPTTTTSSTTTMTSTSTTTETSTTTTAPTPQPSNGPTPSSTSTTTFTTSTNTPSPQTPTPDSPNHHNNNTGDGNPKSGGLSPGATAGIVILMLLLVGLGGGFAYLKRDRIKQYLNIGGGSSSSSSGYRRAARELDINDNSGYGAVSADDELASRRMSMASSAADTNHHV